MPDIKPEFILFTLAFYYFAHLLAVFRAFRYANLSTLAPFDFSRLVISTFVGYLVFNNKIDQYVILGSIVIIGSTAQIIWNKEMTRSKNNDNKVIS
jgi:S-adenosylmethionine uptake transporter